MARTVALDNRVGSLLTYCQGSDGYTPSYESLGLQPVNETDTSGSVTLPAPISQAETGYMSIHSPVSAMRKLPSWHLLYGMPGSSSLVTVSKPLET